jgi:PEP-CTERM motif-containing protein
MRSALAFVLAVCLHASGVHAEVLFSTSFAKNFPFGPFLPQEAIEVIVTLTNISPDQTITICEGVCIGDVNTYSLGGLASIPPGYTFFFGDDPVEAVFDGQIAGPLLPGAEKDFIFGVYTPTVPASPGLYPFGTQLQIFAATAERPMLDSSTFSGNWEVVPCSPFPGGGSTGGCFPGPFPFPAPEPATLALLAFGLGWLGFVRRNRKTQPSRN